MGAGPHKRRKEKTCFRQVSVQHSYNRRSSSCEGDGEEVVGGGIRHEGIRK